MKVLGYTRVSTDEQASGGVSLEAQRFRIERYAELYGLELVDVVTDAGVSAKDLKREGLRSVLEALDSGQVEGLVVAKLDRLTRSVRDLSSLLEGYFGTRFALLSVEEKIDTSSAAGRMILNIMATVSQWEREVIGERTSAALRHKMEMGQRVGAPALGYRVNGGKLEKEALEQKTVQKIRRLRAKGWTLQAIADKLNAESVPTKRGGRWHPSTVTYIVRRAR